MQKLGLAINQTKNRAQFEASNTLGAYTFHEIVKHTRYKLSKHLFLMHILLYG